MSDETRHSPEPWVAKDDGRNETIVDANGNEVVGTDWEQHGYTTIETRLEWPWWSHPDNRRRIVACVNATAGIPTEALETGALDAALRPFAGILVTLRMAGDPIIGGKPVPEAVARSIIGSFREGEEALRLLGRLP